jgi:hypothetical protein
MQEDHAGTGASADAAAPAVRAGSCPREPSGRQGSGGNSGDSSSACAAGAVQQRQSEITPVAVCAGGASASNGGDAAPPAQSAEIILQHVLGAEGEGMDRGVGGGGDGNALGAAAAFGPQSLKAMLSKKQSSGQLVKVGASMVLDTCVN